MNGKIHSFQSLGTLDGPGVRFIVFMHGCNLKCGYCHNIDVVRGDFTEYTPDDVLKRVLRYKEYFTDGGGITVSGGEPLLQAEFVCELFRLCKNNGINTALDTSGSIMNDVVEKLLEYTDTVLLDIKMSSNGDYEKYIGCSIEKPLEFLKVLDEKNINCIIRQVIVEGINDNEENIEFLKNLRNKYKCIQKIELLPFHKMCSEKYEKMNIEFPFDAYPQTSRNTIDKLNKLMV